MKILSTILFVCTFLPGVAFADGTTNPLLQSTDMTYLGTFSAPTEGGLPFECAYSGVALAVLPGGKLTLGCGGGEAGIINIPSDPVDSKTATTDTLPVPITGDTGTTGSTLLSGAWYSDTTGKLYFTKRVPYDNASQTSQYAIKSTSTTLGSQTTMQAFSVGGSPQHYSGFMGGIPSEWATLLGYSAFAGNNSMSILTASPNGPTFFGFDPATVDGSGTVTSEIFMDFGVDTPLTDGETPNDWWSKADQWTSGAFFPPGYRSVLYVIRHGYGTYCYGVCASDLCSSGSGEHQYPYRVQVLAFDANDLLAVKNGTKQPYEVEPYTWWELPEYAGGNCPDIGYGGLAFDPDNMRVYVVQDYLGYDTPNISVYQLADLSAPDTTSPTVTSASVDGSTVTVNFDETVVTTGYDAGDFNLDCTTAGSNISLTSPSGSGASRTFTAATSVAYGDTCDLDYIGTTNDIEDSSGNDLVAFSGTSITVSTEQEGYTASLTGGSCPGCTITQ